MQVTHPHNFHQTFKGKAFKQCHDFRTYDPNHSAACLLTVLTGKEYNRMARKRSTMKRMMSPMKRHLNLLHTMNFMVLQGLVNQKKDVSGRLVVTENETHKSVLVRHDNLPTAGDKQMR